MVICFYLSQYKGLAVGALFFGWVGFVGAYLNFTQRAVVLFLCVVSALLNGTFDTLVYVTCHGFLPPESLFGGTAIIINRLYIFIRCIAHTYFSEYCGNNLEQIQLFQYGNKNKQRKAGYYRGKYHVLPGEVGIGIFVLRHNIAGNSSRGCIHG